MYFFCNSVDYTVIFCVQAWLKNKFQVYVFSFVDNKEIVCRMSYVVWSVHIRLCDFREEHQQGVTGVEWQRRHSLPAAGGGQCGVTCGPLQGHGGVPPQPCPHQPLRTLTPPVQDDLQPPQMGARSAYRWVHVRVDDGLKKHNFWYLCLPQTSVAKYNYDTCMVP
jgi:hypothetical protein